MAVTAELLRELHRMHQQLADLRERLERGPRQIRARELNVEKFNEQLSDAQTTMQKTKMAADQKQLDLQTGENKIVDLGAKLNTSSSNKEFHALQEQIAASKMANSVLEDEILESFDKVELLKQAVAKAQHEANAGKAELEKSREKVAAEAVLMKADMTRLEGELAEAEKGLTGDFREDYNRVIRSKGADGMSLADGRICTGCGQQMTLNMHNDLLLSKPIFCKACGRMLYIGEE
ncbi:zinc ribbon domain-containing protein [Adhaeretor mobilis]|uniref:Zinc ribbon domain protein n=1 Tax=Adhaeretor mobilis TaxID=1930276 RepID=A0A517MUL5_9BACT|nr:phospholipase [Adhaeretor mobilis]QDS98581.1 Putative zinc ribbon domain protein [Adhaeretor mobilis]